MDQQRVKNLAFKKYYILYFLLCFHSYLSAQPAETFYLLPEHSSHYSIKKYGNTVGHVNNQLSVQGNEIKYISTAKSSGLAALFIKDDTIETSTLYWQNPKQSQLPRQQHYQLFRGDKHKRNQLINFNWHDNDQLEINGTYKKRSYQLTTDKHTWTRQLIPLLMSNDLTHQEERKSNQFHITDRGNLQNYTYTLIGKEEIQFSGKKVQCLKYKIQRDGSSRKSYAWLSSKHYYLPLKIEQYKKGELNVTMDLTALNIHK